MIERPGFQKSFAPWPLLFVAMLVIASCSERVSEPRRAASSGPASLTTTPNQAPSNASLLHDTNYVVLAGGVYHKSCVHSVPNGGHTRGDTVFMADGRMGQVLPACNHPSLLFRAPAGGKFGVPSDTGWVVDERGAAPNGSWRSVSAKWTVPANPANGYSGGQYWFTFDAIETSGGILQPVLSWNQGGNHKYQFGPYYCQSTSCSGMGTLIDVSVGDLLQGSVVASNCTGGNCDFTVTATDVTTSASSSHTWTSIDNASVVTAGAMEAVGLVFCGDYPDGPIKYSNITMADRFGSAFPHLRKVVGPNNTPSCGADASPNAVTTTTASTIKIKNLLVAILGPTNVYTNETCTYSSSISGGWGKPYSSFSWSVDWATITGGQGTTAINVVFPTDDTYTAIFSGHDSLGVSGSAVLGITAQTPTGRVSGCEG